MAVVTALMALMLMLALGAGVTVTTMTETAIAANHRDGIQASYAAEAGVVLGVSHLRATADWRPLTTARGGTALLTGRLADLAPSGSIDPNIHVSVSVSPDPGGDPDALVMESIGVISGGIRRTVQVVVRRLAPDANGVRAIHTSAWR